MDIETDNLRCRKNLWGVDLLYLVLHKGEFYLSSLEDADDLIPPAMSDELEDLRDRVRDADEAGRGYDATRRHADAMRHSPEGWK